MTRTPKCGERHSSVYRGVSRHSKTRMYDAYIWIPNVPGNMRRGRQRYIGGFEREVDAAHAYDLARVKLGPYKEEDLNLSGIDYEAELRPVWHLTFEEYMKHLREVRAKKRVVPAAPHEGVVPDDALLPTLLEGFAFDDHRFYTSTTAS